MILGLGVDILDIQRIKKIFTTYPNKLAQHLLSNTEKYEFDLLSNDANKIAFLSKRFVAKEALGKAIGCGINNKYLSLKDITIAHDRLGRPFFIKNAKITEAVRKLHHLSNYELLLSIADEKNYAVAHVILQDIEHPIMGFVANHEK